MSDNEERLVMAASLMDLALSLATGLQERERKLVTYWTLATHALPHLDTFSLLVLVGRMGTGKSQTLKIINKFARRPRKFSLRGMTLATIRDELAECELGTAIIEEGDLAWKDPGAFEALLSDRYEKDSARAALKESVGDGGWVTRKKEYFGATALHRRIPFNDAALDGRSVRVRFKQDHSKQYLEYTDDAPWIVEGSQCVRDLIFELPAVKQPSGVAARIFNTYKMPLSMAKLCRDEEFSAQIGERLLLESNELMDAQSGEPDGLVVRAIFEGIREKRNFAYLRVSSLAESIFRNHRVPLQPRQVAVLARQLGFTTKNSHGMTVVVPTPATLLRACEECGYEDEAIADLRKKMLGASDG